MTWEISGALATGLNPKYMPRNEMPNAGGNCYQTKDGRWFRITFGPTKNYWSTFCQVIEREDLENDPRFDSMEAILNNRDALFKLLDQEVFPTKTLAEWKERFAGSGIPYSPLQTITEVTADQDAIDNEFFLPCEHPVHGRVMHVTNPPNLSRTPQEIKEPAPELDQHQEEVLLEIGYNREEIKALKQRGAID
jgi:crotonobetainyl-CoA:carnitine CoA-transferase CaiB-like acyl-CoA transferase